MELRSLTTEQFLLTLLVRLAAIAVLATMLARFHRFRRILIFERRGWVDRLVFTLSLGVPLMAGVTSRVILKYDAADLTLDTANPRPKLIEDVVRLTDKAPGIRVVIDHLPGMDALDDPAQRPGVEKTLRELAQRNVFVKVSAVARRVEGKVVTDPAAYKPRLDLIWNIFGPDRLVYGSDWPNSAGNWVSYETALSLVRQYFDAKGREVAEKYFWKNSVAAYKWVKRDRSQPGEGL